MASTATSTGSAERHGLTWGTHARDWAANEEQQVPTYEAALDAVGPVAGRRILEVGCGSGVFLRCAADRGAAVIGLDAAPALLDLARARVPEAELHLADMQQLPFDDDTFDVVAGFNAFFFAADMVAALREAGRVARPAAPVVIQVWGAPDRCDLTAMKEATHALLAPDPAAQAQPGLWEPGVLEGIATVAGLVPERTFDLSWPYVFADEDALARAMLAPGLIVELVDAVGEQPVREAILTALEPFRGADGAYRLENQWHVLVARSAAPDGRSAPTT